MPYPLRRCALLTLQWLQAKERQPGKIHALERRADALHESLQRNTSELAADAIQSPRILDTFLSRPACRGTRLGLSQGG